MGVAVTTRPALGAWYDDWLYNVRGVQSPDQKAALIASEAADLVQASGGTLSQTDAVAQATSDVTKTLTADSADPSQDTLANTLGLPHFPGGSIGIIVAGGVALLLLLRATR